MLLKNKTAVITGANRGIGLEIVKSFSLNGASKIFACLREKNEDQLKTFKKIEKEFNNQIIPVQLDLSKADLLKNAIDEIFSHQNEIDILVNNAGTIFTSLVQMTSIKTFKEVFEINVFGQIQFTQNILKKMTRKNGGSIIFISSTSATDSVIGRSAYSSSKNAINSFALTLSRELGRKKIRVNVISPGLTNTDMMKKNTSENIINNVINQSALLRVAEPVEIANSVTAISSDLFSFMTGQIVRIDGGM